MKTLFFAFWLLLAVPAAAQEGGAGDFLYVCNQLDAAVTVIDMERNEVVETVDLEALGFSPNAQPHHVAVEPDGAHWYVSLIGDGKVLKFNRANELVGQADFETPGMLAVDPASSMLYVGRSMMAVDPPPSIGLMDRETMALDELDVFFPRPHALVLSAANRHVYTASLAENRVASVDVDEENVELLSVDGPIHTLVQFAVSPDGQTMVAGGQLTGQVLFFDLSNPASPQVTEAVEVGGMPWHPVFTPDGRYVYIGNQGTNQVTVLDAAAREVVTRIEGRGLAEPHGIAVRPDGRYVYVSNRNLKGTYRPGDAPAAEPAMSQAPRHDAHVGRDAGEHEVAEHDTAEHGMREQGTGNPASNHGGGQGDAHGAGHGNGMMAMNMNPTFGGTVTVIDTQTNEIVKVLDLGRYPSGMSTRAES